MFVEKKPVIAQMRHLTALALQEKQSTNRAMLCCVLLKFDAGVDAVVKVEREERPLEKVVTRFCELPSKRCKCSAHHRE